MKYNPKEVADLQPDYLGFIFWEPSSRYFDGVIPKIPSEIEKIGVFVDAHLTSVLDQIEKSDLQGVQLHGNESSEFCKKLKESTLDAKIEIIKVFSVKQHFDFNVLQAYEDVCDYYLFDTKGELPGGNGFTFDWSLLKDYPSSKPYFLSGGIGLENVEEIKEFMRRPESNYCHAIDVNSKFEEKPGLKNIERLKKFKSLLSI